ncbi:MAG: SPOR domain-containing protein [Alphaproteobacteria bacterium]
MRKFLVFPAVFVLAGSAVAGVIAISTIFLADANYFTGTESGERAVAAATESDCAEPRTALGQNTNAGCSGGGDIVVAAATRSAIAATPDRDAAVIGKAELTAAKESDATSGAITGAELAAVTENAGGDEARVATPEAPSSMRLAREMASAVGTPRPAANPSTATPPVTGLAAWDGPTGVTPPWPLPHPAAAEPETPPQPEPTVETTGDPENRKATYLVVASYRLSENADRLIERLQEFSPTITAAPIEGKVYFRVVTGPYTSAEITAVRERLAAKGLGESWAISLCTADLSAPPCAAPEPSAGAPAALDIATTDPIKPPPAK